MIPSISNDKVPGHTRRISFIQFLTVLSIVTIQHGYAERIRIESNFIHVKYEHELNGGPTGFHHSISISMFNHLAPMNCSQSNFDSGKPNTGHSDTLCLKWADLGKFRILKKDSNCDTYELTSTTEKSLRVRFDTSHVQLYGGPEQDLQSWPVDYNSFTEYSYVSKELDSQAVLEPLWYTTNGMYLYVDPETPLFITQNKGKGVLELIAARKAPYIRSGDLTMLKYTVCKLSNIKEAYKHAVDNFLGKPKGLPNERMVRYPIWSTWAKYKTAINATIVMEYANIIAQSELPNGQLEIDDKWETCYGSLMFDKNAFPDVKNLVQRLKNMTFYVTVWAHPFVNEDCQTYHSVGIKNEYFVKDIGGSVRSRWWNGLGSYIDFTNPNARDWWVTRLKTLQAETGIDGYKFDAGESSWSPQPAVFYQMLQDHPETILKTYINAAAEFGNVVEVRSARQTQSHPIFVRMIDRETVWDGRLGLNTLIPTLLQMNIIGYPFVLPDMIGGNGYNGMKVTDEMFIRWLQINVFMPSLQFSYPPSEFGKEVLRLTKKFVDLHMQYSDKILQAMQNSVDHGTPVNPPLWWIDPTDPITYNIDSEFLLGEDILVAPVIQKGAQSRDIYLPKGLWKDQVNENANIIKGPVWLYNYPADLETLPYFTKITTSESKDGTTSSGICMKPILVYVFLVFMITMLK